VQVFIAKSSRYLSIAIIVAMALALASVFATDGILGVLLSTPLVLTIVSATLMLFWFPRVEVSEQEVVIKNVIRSYKVPMQKIARIDTRWALALYLEGGKKITSWSATAPGRHTSIFASREQGQHLPESTYLAGTVRPGDLISTDSGAAAATIRRYWEQQRDGGGIQEDRPVVVSWNISQLAVLLGLIAVNFLVLSR
jgi:hypothetical protein